MEGEDAAKLIALMRRLTSIVYATLALLPFSMLVVLLLREVTHDCLLLEEVGGEFRGDASALLRRNVANKRFQPDGHRDSFDPLIGLSPR
jgi:hypothetical protein